MSNRVITLVVGCYYPDRCEAAEVHTDDGVFWVSKDPNTNPSEGELWHVYVDGHPAVGECRWLSGWDSWPEALGAIVTRDEIQPRTIA